MNFGVILKLFHVLTVIWYMSGVIGRGIAFGQAAKTTDIHIAYALVKLSNFFEQRMVIPGSAAVLLFGMLTAWRQGWPLFGFLQGSPSNWLLVSLVLYLSPTPLIPLYLIPRRKHREKVADEALTKGQITPELTAALKERGVLTYRTVELMIAFLVTVLMVTKPF